MDKTKVIEIAGVIMDKIPETVTDALSKVRLVIAEDCWEAANHTQHAIPFDCKGVFIGFPAEVQDPDGEQDEESFEVVSPAEGTIVLVASQLTNEREAAAALLHEIGHAIDLSEEEVDQLGLGMAGPEENSKDDAQPVQRQ